MKKSLFIVLFVGILFPLTFSYATLGSPDGSGPSAGEVMDWTGTSPGAADACATLTSFKQLVACAIDRIFTPLVSLLIALAVLYFIWGVFQYIREAGNDAKRAEANQMMLWGIIFIFVMVSVWGLVNILVGTFSFNQTIPMPKF
jgi:hypothetical protein